MQNPSKLTKHTKIFPSDRIAAELIKWLNTFPDSDLHRMVFELRTLDQLVRENNWSRDFDGVKILNREEASERVRDWFLGKEGQSSEEAPSRESEKEEWARIEFGLLADSISSKMRVHQFATYSAIAPNRFFRLRRDEPKMMRKKPYALVRRRYDAGSADPETAVSEFHETLAFRAFEEIVDREWAWRLRRCDLTSCRRWFCARKVNQIYCPSPARCRQRKWEGSPEFKEWRKNNAASHKKKSFRSTSKKS